jgi:hypothetical protein
LPLGLGTLWYAVLQLSLARKASSAAAIVPLNDTFRECWLAYVRAESDTDRRFQFAELANALELACAIYRDKLLFGASREVLEHYLVNVFVIIEANSAASKMLGEFLQAPKTWENIVYFLSRHRKELEIARVVETGPN